MVLRTGMSVLLGGILGNVTDRIVWGHVVDFILIGNFETHSPAFNLADALQWVGYAMIVTALIKEGDVLWPLNNTRKTIWVNPKFQLKYSLTLTGFGLALFLIAGVYSYTFLRVTIIELVGRNTRIIEQFLIPFTLTFIIVSLAFALVLFLLGRVLSHRTAGPLYAFEKFLDDALDGKVRPLKLRVGDDFQHLEELAERINEVFAKYQIPEEIANLKAQGLYPPLETPLDEEAGWDIRSSDEDETGEINEGDEIEEGRIPRPVSE
jgi:signal peptidase II